MSRGGSPWVCRTCGLQYTATETPPEKCKTCLDERQYVGADVRLLSKACVSAATFQLPARLLSLLVVRQVFVMVLSLRCHATILYDSMHVCSSSHASTILARLHAWCPARRADC